MCEAKRAGPHRQARGTAPDYPSCAGASCAHPEAVQGAGRGAAEVPMEPVGALWNLLDRMPVRQVQFTRGGRAEAEARPRRALETRMMPQGRPQSHALRERGRNGRAIWPRPMFQSAGSWRDIGAVGRAGWPAHETNGLPPPGLRQGDERERMEEKKEGQSGRFSLAQLAAVRLVDNALLTMPCPRPGEGKAGCDVPRSDPGCHAGTGSSAPVQLTQ
ncbi:hypothetical protein CDD83_9571 [Cordyceps sp. RAO-2017]|nr:hypothetical protein CDD83_9571 [Cordyceps sp. RAO-2017]